MSTGQRHSQKKHLFDTPSERVVRSLKSAVAAVFEQLLSEESIPALELRKQIPAYLAELESAQATHEFLDLGLARKTADRCLALLDGIDTDTPPETRCLIQAAVRYFLLDEDANSDKRSLIGFDDDARVVELVAREIDREDVLG